VEDKEAAAESACKILGDDCGEDDAELLGESILPNPELLFGLDEDLEYDACERNFCCE
jgi:hypothetical protein